MLLDNFIDRFGGMTESYYFYNGEVELRYDPKDHVYLLVNGDALEPQDGVTTVCHIIDKSEALIPWACKQMATKLLTDLTIVLPDGQKQLRQVTYQDFENLVIAAKTAHRDRLEEAGEVGHIAHAWIEMYIKAILANDQSRQEELLAKFPDDERARNCCFAALGWMKNHNVRWIGTERKIYSRKWKYAGTLDGLCVVDSCSDPKCCPRPFKDRLTVSDWKTSNYLYKEYRLQTAAYQYAYEEETGEKIQDRWIIRLGKEDAEFDPWHVEADQYYRDFQAFRLALELRRTVGEIDENIQARDKARREAEKAERQAAKAEAERLKREEREKRKAEEKAAREAALKVACPNSKKYKGLKKPRCNGGEPCETCLKKYAEVQAAKPKKEPKKKKVKGGVQNLLSVLDPASSSLSTETSTLPISESSSDTNTGACISDTSDSISSGESSGTASSTLSTPD